MQYAIEAKSLSVEFTGPTGSVAALSQLSFVVEQGTVVGFLGPNGAGKTTAIHTLLGFVEPTSGGAKIFGEDVGLKIARRRIGYLPEHPEAYKFLRGSELLRMYGRLFGLRGQQLKRRVADVLAKVDLRDAAKRNIGTYSRGMMQRIGVAQALINDPDLLILDEPTGGLDPIGRLAMREIISDLKAQGKTVFFSSHELSEVELVCDRVVLLNAGKMVAHGKIDDLVNPDQSLEQYFIEEVCAREEVQ